MFLTDVHSGVRHDRRGKRGGGTMEEQTPWPDPTVRNGNEGQAACKTQHGARDAKEPKRRGTFSGI